MQEAVERGERFNVVVLDCMMPEMDGFAFAERVRGDAQLKGCGIVMVSSAARPGDAARCRNLAIARYLTKPVIQSELLNTILNMVGAKTVGEILSSCHTGERPSDEPTLKVLLAEDGLINQRVAVGLLKMKGHAVTIANNGKEAVSAVENGRFDVVLMDVQMPEMDGFEATKVIREKEQPSGRHTPIVAMTASAMKGDRERCLEAGMDNYISKPIDPVQLYALLDEYKPSNQNTVTASGRPLDVHASESDNTMNIKSDVFDFEAALERIPGGMDIVKEMAELMMTECPKLLAELRAGLDTGKAQEVQRAAHTIKGSASVFGAKYVVERASRMEQMGREGDLSEGAAAFADLEIELNRLIAAMKGVTSSSSF
jgi:CheY-like chemotaxis protein